MPGRAPTANTHRHALDRHGQSVTHTTFNQTGSDAYGDPTSEGETTSTVTARFSTVNTPRIMRGPDGDDVDVDAEIIVGDSVSVTDLDEGDGRPDEFAVGGVDYLVLSAERQDNGLISCRCVRK